MLPEPGEGMDIRVQIDLQNWITGTQSTHVLALPVEFGRKPHGANFILLHPEYPTISRRHGTLAHMDGKLIYRDHSSNGTQIGDRTIKHTEIPVRDGGNIILDYYKLSVKKKLPYIVLHTSADLVAKDQLAVPFGESACILRDSDGLALELGPEGDGGEGRGQGAVGLRMCFPSEAGEHQAGADTTRASILVNKKAVTEEEFMAPMFSVIEIDEDRFEVLRPGHELAVCGNVKCQLLNPAIFERNCRWCGFHLAAAGAVTRVIGSGGAVD